MQLKVVMYQTGAMTHPIDVQAWRNDGHVERVEKHTPQTLHGRNGEFEKLANELGLESYDGMDVGPVLTE